MIVILTIVTFAQKWPLLTMRHVLEEVVFKGVFKKVNPNNSVNIEIKGGSGAGGGSKKNGVPPSPAASKKVHKYASKKYSSKNCGSKKFHIDKYFLQYFHHHHHPPLVTCSPPPWPPLTQTPGATRRSVFAPKPRDDLVACKHCQRNFAEDRVWSIGGNMLQQKFNHISCFV